MCLLVDSDRSGDGRRELLQIHCLGEVLDELGLDALSDIVLHAVAAGQSSSGFLFLRDLSVPVGTARLPPAFTYLVCWGPPSLAARGLRGPGGRAVR